VARPVLLIQIAQYLITKTCRQEGRQQRSREDRWSVAWPGHARRAA
jgi:hypothetical protein